MSLRVHQDGDGKPVLIVGVEGGTEYALPLTRAEPYEAAYDEDGSELPYGGSRRDTDTPREGSRIAEGSGDPTAGDTVENPGGFHPPHRY